MIPEGTKNANAAWLALKTDAARADFIESGDAYFHGLISPFVAADIARAFRRLASEPAAEDCDEKRVEELRKAVSRHESEGTPATLGTLRKRNGFEPVEVERLAKRFPAKLALVESRNPRGGPAAKVVSFGNDEKRVEELRKAVTHLEAEGIAPSLGHLKNRHAFNKEEVQRLAKRFPGKLTLNQGRTGKRGPVSDLVSFLDSPRA